MDAVRDESYTQFETNAGEIQMASQTRLVEVRQKVLKQNDVVARDAAAIQ